MTDAKYHQEISKIITQLTAAIQNAGIYPADHPRVISHIEETHKLLGELLMHHREITILLIGDNFIVENKPLFMSGSYETAFIGIMKKNGIERISFLRGLTLVSLEELIRGLSNSGSLSMRKTPSIKLGKIELKDERDNQAKDNHDFNASDKDSGKIVELRDQSPEQMIQDIYQNAQDNKNIDINAVDEIVLQFMESIRKEANPLKLLAEIKSNDEYTFIHTTNVGILSMALAENLGFRGRYINNIGIAAILHDVGKTTTPDEILSKPGALTKEERSVMESHTVKGAMYLMELKGVNNLAILTAMEHHIKYDGSGYPRVKGGWAPNIVSQIISIADVFDALRTMRPYRGPMPQDQIVQILTRESGTSFNPYIVRRFLKIIQQ